MAQFNFEIAAPALPITAVSLDAEILRLREWLVVRGASVGEMPAAAPGTAAAIGIDGDFGPTTQAGCATFAAAAGLAGVTVDAAFWRALTSGMQAAFGFQPAAALTAGEAVVATARAHLAQQPLEARRFIDGGLKGRDNSGPWVRAYCLGISRPMVPGRRITVGEAGLRLTWPAAAIPTRRSWDRAALRAVHRGVGAPERPPRAGLQRDARPAGFLFFVRGTLNGQPSHIHVGVTISPIRPDGRFDSIEGNTNTDGSQNGWEVCQRTRSRAGCDFGVTS